MEIKLPKNQWEIFTTTYKAQVKCPNCGTTTYLDLVQYGPNFSQYSWAQNKNWTQTRCDFCGELLVAYMTEEEGTKEQLDKAMLEAIDIHAGTLYRIQAINDESTFNARNYGYIEAYSPVLKDEDNFTDEWSRLVVMDSKDSPGVVIYCGSLEDCKKYLALNFYIFEEA